MRLIKVRPTGNRYPYLPEEFRKENPQTTYPRNISEEDFNSFGVYIVKEVSKPKYDKDLQALVELEPELIDGIWIQQWTVRDKTNAEIRETLTQKENDRYSNLLKKGFKMPNRGYHIKIEDFDRNEFDQLRTQMLYHELQEFPDQPIYPCKQLEEPRATHRETREYLLPALDQAGIYYATIFAEHSDNLIEIENNYPIEIDSTVGED